jgi:hypothetical protein
MLILDPYGIVRMFRVAAPDRSSAKKFTVVSPHNIPAPYRFIFSSFL